MTDMFCVCVLSSLPLFHFVLCNFNSFCPIKLTFLPPSGREEIVQLIGRSEWRWTDEWRKRHRKGKNKKDKEHFPKSVLRCCWEGATMFLAFEWSPFLSRCCCVNFKLKLKGIKENILTMDIQNKGVINIWILSPHRFSPYFYCCALWVPLKILMSLYV